jgi:hypothetical protein
MGFKPKFKVSQRVTISPSFPSRHHHDGTYVEAPFDGYVVSSYGGCYIIEIDKINQISGKKINVYVNVKFLSQKISYIEGL